MKGCLHLFYHMKMIQTWHSGNWDVYLLWHFQKCHFWKCKKEKKERKKEEEKSTFSSKVSDWSQIFLKWNCQKGKSKCPRPTAILFILSALFLMHRQSPKMDLVFGIICAEENALAQICFVSFEKFLTNFRVDIFVALLDDSVLWNVVCSTQVVPFDGF